jgi:hypothetical protein
VDYRQGIGVLLPHLSRQKFAAQWLALATVWNLRSGQFSNAWSELKVLTALAGRNSAEPLMISELVRMSVCQIALGAGWEAWQSPDLREPELAKLQVAWEEVDFWRQAEAALAMERAMRGQWFEESRQSGSSDPSAPKSPGGGNAALTELSEMGKQLFEDPNAAVREVVLRYPRFWAWKHWFSYDEELVGMQFVQAGIEAARSNAQSNCSGAALKNFHAAADRITAEHRGFLNRFGMAVTAEEVQRFLERISYLEMQRTILITALALKRYQQRHGSYPADLTSLAPEFMRAAPRDPMDGDLLRYRQLPDGTFLLYSVGVDGVDNGGDPSPPKPSDVAYGSATAKQWWRAHDAVWPWPATPEQIKADYNEMAKIAANASFRRRYGMAPAGGTHTNAVTNATPPDAK